MTTRFSKQLVPDLASCSLSELIIINEREREGEEQYLVEHTIVTVLVSSLTELGSKSQSTVQIRPLVRRGCGYM